MKKKKENTRYNTEYEEAHKKMLVDASPDSNSDLDIIT
jgi:hypothetical protein